MTAYLLTEQPHDNNGLFSDHYLNVTLPGRQEWRYLANEAHPVMEAVAGILRSYVPSDNEAQTERDLVRPVLEILVGMGYHVPYVAPPGPDGGIDIVAYKDPLGTSTPRIRVQVKHREQKLSVREARELEGLLRREGDVGLLVPSGGFTSEVERELRSSNKHMETMDLNRLIGLWQEHYDKIRESGKALLPLVRVFFLAPPEE